MNLENIDPDVFTVCERLLKKFMVPAGIVSTDEREAGQKPR